jgi:hypothetical protein
MRHLCGALVLAVAATATGAAAGDRWVHIRVDDRSERDSSVDVQVPLSMISAMLPTLKARVDAEGLTLHGRDLSLAEAREYWTAVRNAKDGDYVRVRDAGDDVRVSKKGGFLLVDVDEKGDRGAKVRVRMPASIVDAVLGRGEAIDLDALAKAFADLPDGDVVLVEDGDSHVRIWIDGRPAEPKGGDR